jgi:hypothetical protein
MPAKYAFVWSSASALTGRSRQCPPRQDGRGSESRPAGSGSNAVPGVQDRPSGTRRDHPADSAPVVSTLQATDFTMTVRPCRPDANKPASIEARERSVHADHSHAEIHLLSRSNSVKTRSESSRQRMCAPSRFRAGSFGPPFEVAG